MREMSVYAVPTHTPLRRCRPTSDACFWGPELWATTAIYRIAAHAAAGGMPASRVGDEAERFNPAQVVRIRYHQAARLQATNVRDTGTICRLHDPRTAPAPFPEDVKRSIFAG
jgi:hypothetical protein